MLDSNPIPTHALLLWCDDRNIYAAIPGTPPHITCFPRNEGGLSKALNLLRIRHEELPSASRNYTMPPAHISSKNGKPPVQNDAQRTHALAVLRKMGIV